MGKKSPKTPDVVGAAQEEGEQSRETARDKTYADRPDQYSTMGSNTWGQTMQRDPATGEMVTKWTQNQTLSPDMQNLYDTQMQTNQQLGSSAAAMGDRINAEMGTPLNWEQFGEVEAGPQASGVVGGGITSGGPVGGGITSGGPVGGGISSGGPVGGGINAVSSWEDTGNVGPTTGPEGFAWDGQSQRQAAEDASYGRATSRLDPQMEKKRQDLEIRLRNRGLRAGDQAYESEMAAYGRDSTDAYEQARFGATMEGRAEDAQSYGQASNTYGQNLTTEQQRYNQLLSGAQNQRAAEQQEYGQQLSSGQNDRAADSQYFNQQIAGGQNDRAADAQYYNQQIASGQNDRAADAQYYDQRLASGQNDRAADQQAFGQEMSANERANALRQQQIQEYTDKRGFSLQEQQRLQGAQTTGQMVENFSA